MAYTDVKRIYEGRGIGTRIGFGTRPAVVVIDLNKGFTDPASPVGANLDAEITATRQLLEVARAKAVSVFFTVIAYNDDLRDAGLWLEKIPALRVLKLGTPYADIDERLARRPSEEIVVKKYGSSFFGTPLNSTLRARGVDTLILTGTSTSGCVRATAVDALQNGFRCAVVAECTGDRAPEPHNANLFDIDAKYGDVVTLAETIRYLQGLS
jgi:maleamate amidohydrolase